MANDLIPLKLE